MRPHEEYTEALLAMKRAADWENARALNEQYRRDGAHLTALYLLGRRDDLGHLVEPWLAGGRCSACVTAERRAAYWGGTI